MLYNDKVTFLKVNKLFKKNNYNKFNIIFLRHVLEHIIDFDILIPKLKKLLNKDGIIILHRHKKDDVMLTSNLNIIEQRSYGISKITFGN